MDEGVDLYTRRIIDGFRKQVEYINNRYVGYLNSDIRRSWTDEHRYITIGKIECLEDLNHITLEERSKLLAEVNEVTL